MTTARRRDPTLGLLRSAGAANPDAVPTPSPTKRIIATLGDLT